LARLGARAALAAEGSRGTRAPSGGASRHASLLSRWRLRRHGPLQGVAIDDGTNPQAWALTVTGTDPDRLTPGTMVRVKVNPRQNKVLAIEPFRSPASAPQLVNPSPDP
jgi:hypothetical protein